MGMRFLDMNDPSRVRLDHLAKQACIGTGSFASVFAGTADSTTVWKVTTDIYSYALLSDNVWHRMRSDVKAAVSNLYDGAMQRFSRFPGMTIKRRNISA